MEQEAKPWKNSWQPRQHGLPLPQIQYGPWTGATEPRLLDAKNKIVPLEESNRWEVVKKMANPYEMVYTHEDPFFHPSITMLKPLSRSYFKMIELLDVLQFFEKMSKQQPKLRTCLETRQHRVHDGQHRRQCGAELRVRGVSGRVDGDRRGRR